MMDNDQLREERDRLLDENAKMRVSGPTSGNNGGDASTVRYLRSKVSHTKLFTHPFLRFIVDIPLRENCGTFGEREIVVDGASYDGRRAAQSLAKSPSTTNTKLNPANHRFKATITAVLVAYRTIVNTSPLYYS